MEKLIIKVEWCNNNYSGSYASDEIGVVASVGDTLEEFKREFAEAIDFHIDCMLEDGDDMPEWARNKDYEIMYELQASATLRQAKQYTTMAAVSRVSGINQQQLEHYASLRKRPRQPQQEKIKQALRKISENILALC